MGDAPRDEASSFTCFTFAGGGRDDAPPSDVLRASRQPPLDQLLAKAAVIACPIAMAAAAPEVEAERGGMRSGEKHDERRRACPGPRRHGCYAVFVWTNTLSAIRCAKKGGPNAKDSRQFHERRHPRWTGDEAEDQPTGRTPSRVRRR